MSDNRPIGIFDSGVGGLTIAKKIEQVLPKESIIYFGDAKHLPYGNKSQELIQKYATNISEFLIQQSCKAIVIACNTASSNALPQIMEVAKQHEVEVIDVISPVAEKAAYGFHQNMAVIATKATVDSGIYKKHIRKFNKHIKVHELATPLLVPVIEEGLTNTDISRAVIDHYMSHRKLQSIDSIILGCTHYPLIEKEIQQYYEGKVEVIDSPSVVAFHVKNILTKQDMHSDTEASYKFYVSDITKNFQKLAKRFFGNDIHLELKTLH